MDGDDIKRALNDGPAEPRPDWQERVFRSSWLKALAKVRAQRKPGSVCRHTSRGGIVGFHDAYVEFFKADGSSETRAVEAKICDRCGTWRDLGRAADAAVAADIEGARLIQTVEYGVSLFAGTRWPVPAHVLRSTLNAAMKDGHMSTGQMCGWDARSVYYGTDPWDAGWLAAAYFDHEPVGESRDAPAISACVCGHSIEWHGHDDRFPGSTACSECPDDECIAYEADQCCEADQ